VRKLIGAYLQILLAIVPNIIPNWDNDLIWLNWCKINKQASAHIIFCCGLCVVVSLCHGESRRGLLL